MARVYRREDREDEWWIDYINRGRRIRKSLHTKDRKIAELALANLKLKIARNELGIQTKRMRLHDFLDEYCTHLSLYKYVRTGEGYIGIVRLFQAFTKGIVYLDMVNQETLKLYVEWRMKLVKPTTVNGDLIVLNGAFKFAENQGYIPRNPIPKVKRLPVKPKKIEFFLKNELTAILDKAKSERPDLFRVFLFLAYTGCRRGELIHLEWTDLDFQKRTIKFQNKEFWSTKTRENRIIPMHSKIYEELVGIEPKENWVFTWKGGRKLDQHIREAMVSIARSVGIRKKVNIHTFRHSFATHLLSEGSDIITVSHLCGHRDIETTRKYLHLVEDNLKQAIAKLEF